MPYPTRGYRMTRRTLSDLFGGNRPRSGRKAEAPDPEKPKPRNSFPGEGAPRDPRSIPGKPGYDDSYGPAPERGMGVPKTPASFSTPFRFNIPILKGDEAWFEAFNFGMRLGDMLYDNELPGIFLGWYMHFGGWSVCCTGAGVGVNASQTPAPCGACTSFSSTQPPKHVMPGPTANEWATKQVVGSGPIYSHRYVHVYKRPIGTVTRPAWAPVEQPYQRPFHRRRGSRYVPPMARPVKKPGLQPQPRPYDDAKPDPMPEGREGGQPGLPGRGRVGFGPGDKFVLRQGHKRKKPEPGVKEKKLKVNKGLQLLQRVLSEATEVVDLIEALFDAIPDGPCKDRYKKTPGQNGLTTAKQQTAAVYSCWSHLDFEDAVFNIIWNEIEDRVWGTLGIGTRETRRMQATNIGVNKLLSEAFGDAYSDVLGDGEDWLRDQLAKRGIV